MEIESERNQLQGLGVVDGKFTHMQDQPSTQAPYLKSIVRNRGPWSTQGKFVMHLRNRGLTSINPADVLYMLQGRKTCIDSHTHPCNQHRSMISAIRRAAIVEVDGII